MNQVDAQLLARRIINNWHGGPHITEWTGYLTGLDHQAAVEVFEQLQLEREHAPTIATFNHTYRAHTRPPEPPPEPYDGIGRDAYLRRLTARAHAGNITAQEELAIWQARNISIPWLTEEEPDRWNITDRD